MLDRIVSAETRYLLVEEGDRVALLVNSLGSTSSMELYIAARTAINYLRTTLKVACEPPGNTACVSLQCYNYGKVYIVMRVCDLNPGVQVRVERVYVGAFMTALDMAGLSLSLLKVDDQRLARLDAPTLVRVCPPAHSGATCKSTTGAVENMT